MPNEVIQLRGFDMTNDYTFRGTMLIFVKCCKGFITESSFYVTFGDVRWCIIFAQLIEIMNETDPPVMEYAVIFRKNKLTITEFNSSTKRAYA